mmetsp:Transcript_69939/g.194533  ORF Transcript_69939/g.194533 Transcript_69939/m.194533 type:complete len:260 (+) Transcript_69939:1035-1814(+)
MRLDKAQVALRIIEIFVPSEKSCITGTRPPLCSTRSRKLGPSPAMFPSAQTACSRTSSFGDWSNPTNRGRAPCSTTTFVCSAVPDAMFVSTQAASNCNIGAETSLSNSTKRCTMPALMTSAMGGSTSTLRSFRYCCVADRTASGSFDISNCLSRTISPATWEVAWPAVSMPRSSPASAPHASAENSPSFTMRFLKSASSFVCFRSCTAASSRLRRASSASTPFLKSFWRLARRSPKPDIGAERRAGGLRQQMPRSECCA